jgi:hypothetical protein
MVITVCLLVECAEDRSADLVDLVQRGYISLP